METDTARLRGWVHHGHVEPEIRRPESGGIPAGAAADDQYPGFLFQFAHDHHVSPYYIIEINNSSGSCRASITTFMNRMESAPSTTR